MSDQAMGPKMWVPRNLQNDGMIEDVEVAHYTHLSLTQYVTASDYAALREELASYKEAVSQLHRDTAVQATTIDRLREELAQREGQIDTLANFILHSVPGEPSQSQGAVDTAIRVITTLREDLARVTHDYAQLQEAYNAKSAGVPLGPIVGAQTILNQQRHIATLQARIVELEGQPHD
jgi:hypothetical protein